MMPISGVSHMSTQAGIRSSGRLRAARNSPETHCTSTSIGSTLVHSGWSAAWESSRVTRLAVGKQPSRSAPLEKKKL